MAKVSEGAKNFIQMLAGRARQAPWHGGHGNSASDDRATADGRGEDDSATVRRTAQQPVFTLTLGDHLAATGRQISVVIETCVAVLLDHLHEEGLFRIPGSVSKVRKLKKIFDSGILASDLEEFTTDPHAVAGTLKSYLRELPDSLLTHELYSEWLDAAKVSDSKAKLQALWVVLHRLPKPNYENLHYLVKFLSIVCSNSDSNKMTCQNLAIAMSPSFFANSGNDSDDGPGLDMAHAGFHGVIISSLINFADWFFGTDEVTLLELPALLQALESNGLQPESDKNPANTEPPPPVPPHQTSMAGPSSTISSPSTTIRNGTDSLPRHPPRRRKAPAPQPPSNNGSPVARPSPPEQKSSLTAAPDEDRRQLTATPTSTTSTTLAGVVSTLPRSQLRERPSLSPVMSVRSSLRHSNSVDSSSSENLNSSDAEHPNQRPANLIGGSSFAGSLDRKALLKRSTSSKQHNERNSLYIIRNKVIERPSVPPPPVPRPSERSSAPPNSFDYNGLATNNNNVAPKVPPRPAVRGIDLLKKQRSLDALDNLPAADAISRTSEASTTDLSGSSPPKPALPPRPSLQVSDNQSQSVSSLLSDMASNNSDGNPFAADDGDDDCGNPFAEDGDGDHDDNPNESKEYNPFEEPEGDGQAVGRDAEEARSSNCIDSEKPGGDERRDSSRASSSETKLSSSELDQDDGCSLRSEELLVDSSVPAAAELPDQIGELSIDVPSPSSSASPGNVTAAAGATILSVSGDNSGLPVTADRPVSSPVFAPTSQEAGGDQTPPPKPPRRPRSSQSMIGNHHQCTNNNNYESVTGLDCRHLSGGGGKAPMRGNSDADSVSSLESDLMIVPEMRQKPPRPKPPRPPLPAPDVLIKLTAAGDAPPEASRL